MFVVIQLAICHVMSNNPLYKLLVLNHTMYISSSLWTLIDVVSPPKNVSMATVMLYSHQAPKLVKAVQLGGHI